MIWIRLFWNETKLLSRSNVARVVLPLVATLGTFGVNALENANWTSAHGMSKTSLTMSLGSAQYAATGGAAMFALLTLLRLSQDQRKRSRDLLEASQDYAVVVLARIGALLAWACLSTAVTFLVGWLTHLAVADVAYEPGPYLFSYGIVLLPALAVSVLLCSGLYLVLGSLDVSFLTFAVVYGLGLKSSNYLLCWVQTSVTVYSDFGGIDPVGRFMVYNRIVWSGAAVTAVLFGLLVRSRPGYGFLRSVLRNARGGLVPGLLVVFAGFTVVAYIREPFLSIGDRVAIIDLPMVETVRLQRVESRVTLFPRKRTLAANARYTFEKDVAKTDIRFVTNAGLKIDSVQLNGQTTAWKRIPRTDQVEVKLPPGNRAEVTFTYGGTIKIPRPGAFTGYISEQSVYLLENCFWLFQPLTQHDDRIHVSGAVVAPQGLTVVTPGRLESVEQVDQMQVWNYQASSPHLQLGIFAADYAKEELQVGNVTLEFYFCPRHERSIREAKIEKHVADLVSYYQEALGPYAYDSWPVKFVEVPIYKPGGHSSLNVVSVAEYVFNRAPSESAGASPRFRYHDHRLIAHELAHQWWGTSVYVRPQNDWSSEGLVEYTIYRYALNCLSEDIASRHVARWEASALGDRARQPAQKGKVQHQALVDQDEPTAVGERQRQLYSVLPLKLVNAEKRVGAQEFLDRLAAVYQDCQGRSLGYHQFLTAMGLTREEKTVE